MKHIAILTTLLVFVSGCASREAPNPAYYQIDPGQLPPPDVSLNIAGLGPCTDNPDRSLHLDSSKPVNVLVHGCFGSSGQFRGLAQVLAFQGQQTACFTYDDRASLTQSATELRNAVEQLANKTGIPKITVIGHSQGALISRKSLTDLPAYPPQTSLPAALPTDIRLVTISGPFDGILSAQTCGKTWLYPLTLGMLPASCYMVTGAKWADITETSPFIRKPGDLIPKVSNYLKIDTDERNTCRQEENGLCLKDDDVFSLAEQRNQLVEGDARARRVEVRAGHVEIVGDKKVAPTKLIAILQQQGVILPTPPERMTAFSLMLARVYQDEALLTQGVLSRH